MKAWPIAARQLAGHLAGLPHYSDEDKREQRFYPSVLDALGIFAQVKLLSEPNTAYRYSTHGFTLLSAAIEGAAAQPFLEYLLAGSSDGPSGIGLSATGEAADLSPKEGYDQ